MIKKTTKILVVVLAIILTVAMSISVFAGSLTMKDAVNKALKDAKTSKSKVYALATEREGNVYEVDFIKKKNDAEYNYEISKSGIILEKSVDYVYNYNSSRSKIGKKAARQKVSKFSGIKYSIVSKGTCWYEYDDGEGIYEVRFRKGHYRYDYDVLAPTGKIIEYSRDYVR